MPPMTPEPSHSIQIWCRYTPAAEMKKPPLQQHAANTPALRGPTRSSHPPKAAAEERNRAGLRSSSSDRTCWAPPPCSPSYTPAE